MRYYESLTEHRLISAEVPSSADCFHHVNRDQIIKSLTFIQLHI